MTKKENKDMPKLAGLEYEHLPVCVQIVFNAQGMQQMFADVNGNASKPSKSLNLYFDRKNPFNASVVDVIDRCDIIRENIDVDILMEGDKPLVVELPNFVELSVKQTDPGFKGDTAQGGSKPATMETGLVVQVPLFIEEGDVLRIDTRTGKYVTRV